MSTSDIVPTIIANELWRHGLIVDQNSMDHMTLRVYLANQSRVIASHATSARWSEWLKHKTYLLAAGVMPASLFHFYMTIVSKSPPSIEQRELHTIVAAVRTLRTTMHHSPAELVRLIQSGFAYHREHPCTHEAAGEDVSYITSQARTLARNWF